MRNLFSDNITILDIAVIFSIGLLGAVIAGQVMERNNFLNLEFEKMKQKIQAKLEVLWKDYSHTNENFELPNAPDFKHIVENVLILDIDLDESLQEQIIELNKIYLDLINHGAESTYFIDILNAYGPFVGM